MGFKLKGKDSLGFINMNRNKRSVAVNLKSDTGRHAFYELVKTADILVENYRPGAAARLGIDYASLAKLNPRLIYASISGFGQTGPWSQRPGFDLIAQAMGGVMSITGYPDQPPAKAGVPVADIGCALFSLYGILERLHPPPEDWARAAHRRLVLRLGYRVRDLGYLRILGHRADTAAARHGEPHERALSGDARKGRLFRLRRQQRSALAAIVRAARPTRAPHRSAVSHNR